MPVEIGKVEKVDALTCLIEVVGDTRFEVATSEVQQAVLKKAQEAGIPDPAVVPAAGSTVFDRALQKFRKTYKFLGA
jgi:hypothetical protein